MTQWKTEDCAAVSLYRFFAAFAGFDAACPLGFEAECTGDAGGAVFFMEPTPYGVDRYINGSRHIRTSCTVRCRVSDDDTRTRKKTASFFAALTAYITDAGGAYTDGVREYRIRPAAYPARIRVEDGGAVWELRCQVEIREKHGTKQEETSWVW